VRSVRKLDDGRLPILIFSGTIASADEVRDLAALGVAGYVNEYSAVQHILPSLAPHLFPDNFNRRSSPRVVLGIPIQYRFGNTIAAALTLNLSHGGIAIRTTSPLEAGAKIKVRFRMPGSKRDIDADGRVAWSDRRVGMGIQFETVEPGQSDHHRQLRRRAFLLQPEGLSGNVLAHRRRCWPWCLPMDFSSPPNSRLSPVRKTRVDQLVAEGNRGARAVRRAVSNPESYIAATQLGITMASLGLGWIGEPALASMIQPLFQWLPATIAETTAHSIAVAIAFAIVTSLHIVLGELVPKNDCAGKIGKNRAAAGQTDRVIHAGIPAVHPPAEHRRARGRLDARHEEPRRSRDGSFGRGIENARHREPGSGRAGGAGRTNAPSRFWLCRPDRGPGDGAANRVGRNPGRHGDDGSRGKDQQHP
jgi:Tfp pilus assembly protein PilZ